MMIPGWQLALRFGLEVASLLSIGAWIRHRANGPLGWILTLGIPVAIMLAWATFAVKGDPSRSGSAPVPVPGVIRLGIEVAVFVCGAAALIFQEEVAYATSSSWRRVSIISEPPSDSRG
jgi:hypothetical protein